MATEMYSGCDVTRNIPSINIPYILHLAPCHTQFEIQMHYNYSNHKYVATSV